MEIPRIASSVTGTYRYQVLVKDLEASTPLQFLSGKVLGCDCPTDHHGDLCTGKAWASRFFIEFPHARMPRRSAPKRAIPKEVKEVPVRAPKQHKKAEVRTALTHPELKWPGDMGKMEFETVFLDESGRGCLAGSMAVVGVIRLKTPLQHLPNLRDRVCSDIDDAWLEKLYKDYNPAGTMVPLSDIALHDSKILKEHEREHAFLQLLHCPDICFWIELIPPQVIDSRGLAKAWPEGMLRCVEHVVRLVGASQPVTRQLVDGKQILEIQTAGITETQAVVKADSMYRLVAAASILGKVSRDRMITLQADEVKTVHPDYENIFRKHKAYYANKRHAELLEQGYVTKYHRTSFQPLKGFLSNMANDG